MATKDKEKLQAFAQKIHDEGAAGFASGLTPWDTWDDFEDRVGSRVCQDSAEPIADKEHPNSSFGDWVLITMTALAVTTLVIGIVGVYITQEPELQIADSNVQLHSAAPSMTPEIQLPVQESAADTWKADIALNDGLVPVTGKIPVSPAAFGIRTIGMTELPSGAQLANDTAVAGPGTDSHMALVEPSDLPAPAAGVPVQPINLSQLTMQDAHTEALQPLKQDITQPEPASKSGDWSINLASYTKESTAATMKSLFLDKGVAADQVIATVNGKTYYRLQVTGFETREAAIKQSTTIKEQLGLEETWITKK